MSRTDLRPHQVGMMVPFAAFLSFFACRFSFAVLEAGVLLARPPLSLPAMMVAVVAVGDRIVARRHNEREATGDPTAHAEVLALRDAATALGRWRLDDAVLVVTLEPCPMCAGAAWAARIGRLVWGAPNPDAGSVGSLYNLGSDPRLNHEYPATGGIRSEESADLLTAFFARHR